MRNADLAAPVRARQTDARHDILPLLAPCRRSRAALCAELLLHSSRLLCSFEFVAGYGNQVQHGDRVLIRPYLGIGATTFDYSCRRALIGSMREARHAGTDAASSATIVSTIGIPMKTGRSRGWTPKRRLVRKRVRPNAAMRP